MTNNKNKGINLIEYNYSNLITGLLFEETYKLVTAGCRDWLQWIKDRQ